MAIMSTQSWDEVEAEFRKHEGVTGWDVLLSLLPVLRENATYCFYPEADEQGLNLYPHASYDFDMGWGRSISIELNAVEKRSTSARKAVYLHISHVIWEKAVESYETRSWEVTFGDLEKFRAKLEKILLRVAWPRRETSDERRRE